MSSATASIAPRSSESGASPGPSPAGVAGLVHERIVKLARMYERSADEVTAAMAELRAAQVPEWSGQAAEEFRSRVEELAAELQRIAQGYVNLATELRAGAAGLSAHIGAAEQLLDLGTLGSSVLGVLAQAGQWIPQHGPAGPMR